MHTHWEPHSLSNLRFRLDSSTHFQFNIDFCMVLAFNHRDHHHPRHPDSQTYGMAGKNVMQSDFEIVWTAESRVPQGVQQCFPRNLKYPEFAMTLWGVSGLSLRMNALGLERLLPASHLIFTWLFCLKDERSTCFNVFKAHVRLCVKSLERNTDKNCPLIHSPLNAIFIFTAASDNFSVITYVKYLNYCLAFFQ